MSKTDLILEWAATNPSFDATFVKAVKEYENRKGRLTKNQERALNNIIQKFNITQWDSNRRWLAEFRAEQAAKELANLLDRLS